ncbi:hypothetical protein HDV00_002202 [Rhizophlyctis rosea]|nr:hypothetical protein HDV00_002202 [Rhizophlyctis rosea]
MEALDKIHIYVTKWMQNTLYAYHVPDDELPSTMEAGNIVLTEQEVEGLPTTPISQWTAAEKAQAVFLLWVVVHELSHAIASILKADGHIVTTAEFQVKATGFMDGEDVLAEFQGVTKKGRVRGERGWYMEDKLGGQLKIHETTLKLYLYRPEQDRWWEVGVDVMDGILAKDYTLLPIAHEGDWEELPRLTVNYMKGRLGEENGS